MQTENRLFDDLARMANGALNTLTNLREEVESRVRERVERLLAEMDLVTREEFEAVKAMAQKMRVEQEELSAKVAALEQDLRQPKTTEAKPGPAPTRRRAARAKPAQPSAES